MIIYNGNCLEVMKQLEDNSVDSIVTDPPYGLSFMGKKWDYDVPKKEVWAEALRILKPGGHALVACGTRTQHRMVVNIEDAGFEIRDVIAWIYGVGFPKSLNIGKAFDKADGLERDRVKVGDGHSSSSIDSSGFGKAGWAKQNDIPIGENAKKWNGWGTALKPAMELWTLCRKPLGEKTIIKNVSKYGTGGLNIDGSRIETEEIISAEYGQPSGSGRYNWNKEKKKVAKTGKINTSGRYPANVILNEEAGKMLDEQSGELGGGKRTQGSYRKKAPNNLYQLGIARKEGANQQAPDNYGDKGGASRFFYCAKASKSERNAGLEGFEEKQKVFNGQSKTSSKDMKGLEKNFTPSPMKNFHPTVKPLSLMKYLCKLITPPKGIILDLFNGSGSTGVAAKAEGFNYIGIELDPEYCKISQGRIGDIEIKKIESNLVVDEKPTKVASEETKVVSKETKVDTDIKRCPACGGRLVKTKHGHTCEDCMADYK